MQEAQKLKRQHTVGLGTLPCKRNLYNRTKDCTTELFSTDARFARKIEKPQKGIKWADTTKHTHTNERKSSL